MKNIKKKSLVLLIAVALLLTSSVSGTLAYLSASSKSVENTFTPSSTGTEIVEDFKDNVKKDVAIKNTGSIDVYIRAAVVITWEKTDGTVYAQKPVEGEDYQITWTKEGWSDLQSDGFYYYNSRVASQSSTGVLFTNCKPLKSAPAEGYTLHVEIIAQSIQADGMGASNAQQAFALATPSDSGS